MSTESDSGNPYIVSSSSGSSGNPYTIDSSSEPKEITKIPLQKSLSSVKRSGRYVENVSTSSSSGNPYVVYDREEKGSGVKGGRLERSSSCSSSGNPYVVDSGSEKRLGESDLRDNVTNSESELDSTMSSGAQPYMVTSTSDSDQFSDVGMYTIDSDSSGEVVRRDGHFKILENYVENISQMSTDASSSSSSSRNMFTISLDATPSDTATSDSDDDIIDFETIEEHAHMDKELFLHALNETIDSVGMIEFRDALMNSNNKLIKKIFTSNYNDLISLYNSEIQSISDHLKENDIKRNLVFDYRNDHWSQRLQISDEDNRKYVEDVSIVFNDFRKTVETISRIIIVERYMPMYRRTITPQRKGGIAGGDKYVVHGIIFKFAKDIEAGRGTWIYGKNKRNDYLAMKSLNNDLCALNALFFCVKNRRIPLMLPPMCLVNYLGFTVCALALVPIGSETLVYGSADAGRHIFTTEDDQKLHDIVSKVNNFFNLADHPVQEYTTKEFKNMKLAVDIEIHLGKDNKYYALDYARLFPPNDPKNPLVYHFRPEFLKKFPKKLSPDAFSRFGQAEKEKYDGDARKAIKYLLKKCKFEFWKNISDHLVDFDHKTIKEVLHSEGINIRYLGKLRDSLINPEIIEFVNSTLQVDIHQTVKQKKRYIRILLEEMILRSLKTILQKALRKLLRQSILPIEYEYQKYTHDFHFMLMNKNNEFWSGDRLKSTIHMKYGKDSLTPEESDPSYNLLDSLSDRRIEKLFRLIPTYAGYELGKTVTECNPVMKIKGSIDAIQEEREALYILDLCIEGKVDVEEELWKKRDLIIRMNDINLFCTLFKMFFSVSNSEKKLTYLMASIDSNFDFQKYPAWNEGTLLTVFKAVMGNDSLTENPDKIFYFVTEFFIMLIRKFKKLNLIDFFEEVLVAECSLEEKQKNLAGFYPPNTTVKNTLKNWGESLVLYSTHYRKSFMLVYGLLMKSVIIGPEYRHNEQDVVVIISKYCEDLEELTIERIGISDLHFKYFSELKNLVKLNIIGEKKLSSNGYDSVLPNYQGLRSLQITNCSRFESYEFFGTLQNLEVLDLRKCKLLDNDQLNLFISSLQMLTSLRLSGSIVTDFSILHNLPNLIALNINKSRNLTSLPDLSTIESLERLEISQCSNLTEEAMSNILIHKNLSYLDISYSKNLNSNGIEKLKHLSELYLHGLQITNSDLKRFSSLTNLEKVGLRETKVTRTGLNHISKLPKIVQIQARGLKQTSVRSIGKGSLRKKKKDSIIVD